MKGETVEEVVGAARAMRARMTRVPFDVEAMVDLAAPAAMARIDNVSTIAAFVVGAQDCRPEACLVRSRHGPARTT